MFPDRIVNCISPLEPKSPSEQLSCWDNIWFGERFSGRVAVMRSDVHSGENSFASKTRTVSCSMTVKSLSEALMLILCTCCSKKFSFLVRKSPPVLEKMENEPLVWRFSISYVTCPKLPRSGSLARTVNTTSWMGSASLNSIVAGRLTKVGTLRLMEEMNMVAWYEVSSCGRPWSLTTTETTSVFRLVRLRELCRVISPRLLMARTPKSVEREKVIFPLSPESGSEQFSCIMELPTASVSGIVTASIVASQVGVLSLTSLTNMYKVALSDRSGPGVTRTSVTTTVI